MKKAVKKITVRVMNRFGLVFAACGSLEAAGMGIHTCANEDAAMAPMRRVLVPTGMLMERSARSFGASSLEG